MSTYDPSQLSRLRFAEDDATELGKVLEKLGFDVVVMTSQQAVPERVPVSAQDILDQVERRLKDKQPEDTVLLSFSGHGVQLKGDTADEKGAKETYFCPQRAKLNDKSTLVPMSVVMSKLDKCAATRKLLLVDACRNEAESKDAAAKGEPIELEAAGVSRRSVPQGMVVLFSCQAKERSFELPELKHSAFSFHVLKYLKGEAPLTRYPRRQASVTELASYVSRETKDFIDRKLSKDQQPEYLSPGGAADWELGNPGMGHTGAARAGQMNFTWTASVEWAHSGVRVNSVIPGFIASSGLDRYPASSRDVLRGVTRKVPLKRHGTEAEIAAAVVFLLSEAAAYVTGTALRVDGGLHNNARSSFYEVPDHDRSKAYNGFPLYKVPKVLED